MLARPLTLLPWEVWPISGQRVSPHFTLAGGLLWLSRDIGISLWTREALLLLS